MDYDYQMRKNNVEALKQLGERIRKARVQAGMTQEHLAEILNISRISVGKYEAGEIEPKLLRFIEIAKALDVSSDYLLGIYGTAGRLKYLSEEAVQALDYFIKEIISQSAEKNSMNIATEETKEE